MKIESLPMVHRIDTQYRFLFVCFSGLFFQLMDGEIIWEETVSRDENFPDASLRLGNSCCDGKTQAVGSLFHLLYKSSFLVLQKLLRLGS